MAICTNTNGTLPADFVDTLTEPLRNPSGIWADYNPACWYHEKLSRMAQQGLIDANCLPPFPDPADYPDLTSARSAIWLTN